MTRLPTAVGRIVVSGVLLAGVGVLVGSVLHVIQHRRPGCPCGSFDWDTL